MNIIDILEQKGHELKKKTADEYATACPFCGGVDRFCVWSESGKYWCRQCKKHGDAIQLFRDLDGMSFKDAAVAAGHEDVLKDEDRQPVSKNGDKPKIIKTYDYTDPSENLLFQVVRFEPKDFRQRRPDGNGGWVWNVQGVNLVPYNLPQVLKNEYVIFVEGEKDVDRLTSIGLTATCNPMGAGKILKQHQEHNILDPLKGKKISIIPDNDEPGIKHAQTIAELLIDMAVEVKIVELPLSKPGSDVSDYLDGFNDDDTAAESLSMLIEQTPAYTTSLSPSEEENSPKNGTVTMAQVASVTSLLNQKIKINQAGGKIGEDTGFRFMQRCINGFMKSFFYVFGAYTSVGKTALMVQMVVNAIVKNPSIRIIIISTEMACIHILLRLIASWTGIPSMEIFKGRLGPENDQRVQEACKHFGSKNLWLFDSLYTVEAIETACNEIGSPDVVFIDFLQNLHAEGSIYERMSTVPLQLQEMAKKQNTCIVGMSQVNNEAVKNSSPVIGFKGAGEIAAACDLGLWLERDQSEKEILKCYIRKNRHGPTGKVTLKYVNNFTGIEEVTI